MGAKNEKEKDFENSSVTPVFEKSLNNNKIINENQIIDEITNELKEEVILPREDEYYDSSEMIFENKQELKIKDFFDNYGEENSNQNLYKFYPDDIFNCKRSKSFVPKPVKLKTPTLKPNPSDNIFYPFRLSMKSYGIVPKWNIWIINHAMIKLNYQMMIIYYMLKQKKQLLIWKIFKTY